MALKDVVAGAACRGAPAHWFFPAAEGDEADPYVAARALCQGCPVRLECLAWAIETRERHGMWGGHAPAERRALRRRLERIRRVATAA
ncbi:MAG: WhiB family transcriptional regulator [Acidimicrobiia bacterium]